MNKPTLTNLIIFFSCKRQHKITYVLKFIKFLEESSKNYSIDYGSTIKLANFLMTHTALSLEDAYLIIEKCPKSLTNILVKQNLINYILAKNPKTDENLMKLTQ